MAFSINPLDYRILFSTPNRLAGRSFWHEHVPFGMWLVEVLRPRLLVELGTSYGHSYCAFCQAVQELGLPTRCYAVNDWSGAALTGGSDSEAFAKLRRHHDPRYATFSTLIQGDFEAALEQFPDGALDLLHLAGAHAYEEVKQVFDDWLPKMSERGVILLSNTRASGEGCGAIRFFDEVRGMYRHFEFLHGNGLGLLSVGREVVEEVELLTGADGATAWKIRRYFHQQGQRVSLQSEAQTQKQVREHLGEEMAARLREIQALHKDLHAISNSRGWKLLQFLWKARRFVLPNRTEDQRSNGDHQRTAAIGSAGEAPNQTTPIYYNDKEITEVLSGLTDEEWLEVLVRSVAGAIYKGIELPGFPPEKLQERFVGASGEHAIREVFNFYRAIKTYSSELQSPITPDSRILDFGCGWGRIIRFFLKDARRENIFGVDVMPEAIETCRQTKAQGNFMLINNHPPLDFPPESFNIIYAYSVFSHLAEEVHLEWLREFSRLLKPDGLLVVTTQGRWLIEHCRSLRDKPVHLLSTHEQVLSNSFLDTEAAFADYDQGKFLFSATGGGHDALAPSVYGETLIPPAYVGRVWTRYLSFRDFVDDPGFLLQALIVMQK